MTQFSDDSNGPEKRRLPRFHITPCQFHDQDLDKNFSVQDVSHGGLAIRLIQKEDLANFAVGSEHRGVIKLEGAKTEALFKVRHLKGTLVGAEWVAPSDALTEHLKSISLPEYLGKHLKYFSLPDDPDTIWYHNPVGVDLLFYIKRDVEASVDVQPESVIRWMLYVHQSVIQWDAQTLRTGKAMAEDSAGYAHGIVMLETRLIDYDASIDQRLLESAQQVLESASLDHKNLKDWVMAQLKKELL